ncbi:MAG TPA: hypothetical protein VLW50_30525 [Streptosporangiaceae bacterium]|nr:hypothetical protein [Streptosporangiaceae bacterium]
MSGYVYIRSEPFLWTVGYYSPDGKWHSESDHASAEEAATQVRYLNGGTEDDVRLLQANLAEALERIAELERSTPQAQQARYEADLAAADLAASGLGQDPPIGADRHGRGCRCPYCPDEEDYLDSDIADLMPVAEEMDRRW